MNANQLTLAHVTAGRRGLYHAESSLRTQKVTACASPSQAWTDGLRGLPSTWTAMMPACPQMSRRHILAGLAVSWFQLPAFAQPQGGSQDGFRILRAYQNTTTLPNGAATATWSFDGTAPGPALRIKRGEELRIRLINDLPEPTVLHWHGV